MSITYPEHLPIFSELDTIAQTVSEHQVTIIAGETGSGKTTQLPKICLSLAEETPGKIGCTQPRRIAAMTVATRVSEELAQRGNEVGFKIRFLDKTDPQTRIKFMTDGVLLAEIRNDPLLLEYKTLIIDEAHERSLNIDFLLGHLKNILPRRRDLKVIITSATIDTEAFSAHFDKAPIIKVPGKTYPVEVRYRPPQCDERGEEESHIDACISCTLDIIAHEGPGDILIFLPTEKDILNCVKVLNKRALGYAEAMPLYGRLPAADQKKIFLPCKKRKIVVASNVAETSLTVPGIRFVIDTGLARMAYYNFRAKTNSLPVHKISQSSCDQRKGRCGRVGPGVCYRLFEEDDYLQRDLYTIPEIKRSNLAEVILHMVSFHLGDPATFPFIDKPHPSAINDGYRLLKELGAINEKRQLTHIGRIMASMPIDPCISRIIIEANKNGCLREIMVIATVLAIQDPRVRPPGFENLADAAHKELADKRSDFLTFLTIWDLFHSVKEKNSWSRLKKFCTSHFLSFQRMREWIDLHEQMENIIRNIKGFKENEEPADYNNIHMSLAVGFLRNIAQRKEGKIFQGASNKELMIFPGSHQFETKSQWIMAASFLETSRLYALTVAAIEPEWLEPLAGDLCTYSWTNPRYQKKTGQVMASEKVSLFGLTLIAARDVNFARTSAQNMQEARAIFIQEALVLGNLQGNYPFLSRNQQLVKKWEDLENRLRKKNLLSPELAIFQFYENCLPRFVCDRSSLNKFLRSQKSQEHLLLREEDILQRKPEERELADFPPTLRVGSHTFPLSYTFDPASEEDGVTVTLPYELVQALPQDIFEWLVPGLLQEKITFLLKSLPKRLRKQFVPISDTVDRILDDSVLYEGTLAKAIEHSLFKQFKVTMQKSDWPEVLPPHLRMRYRLLDITGKEIGTGRDLPLLLTEHRPVKQATKAAASGAERREIDHWEQQGYAEWNFPTLPSNTPLRSAHNEIVGYLYPAITFSSQPESRNTPLHIQFLNDAHLSLQTTKESLIAYLQQLFAPQFKMLKQYCTTKLSGPSALWLIASFSTKAEGVSQILEYLSKELFTIKDLTEIPKVVKKENFKADIYREGCKIIDALLALLRQRRSVQEEIQRYRECSLKTRSFSQQLFEELNILLDEILPPDFLRLTQTTSVEDSDRYLRGLAIRLERASVDLSKDSKKSASLKKFTTFLNHLEQHAAKNMTNPEKIHHFKQMLHEYRLSLFAPEIKTKYSVSQKKLETLEQEIRRSI